MFIIQDIAKHKKFVVEILYVKRYLFLLELCHETEDQHATHNDIFQDTYK